MKTFFTKLNQFFTGNQETEVLKHSEDSAEGDEGIDNFTFEEEPGTGASSEVNCNIPQEENLDLPQND